MLFWFGFIGLVCHSIPSFLKFMNSVRLHTNKSVYGELIDTVVMTIFEPVNLPDECASLVSPVIQDTKDTKVMVRSETTLVESADKNSVKGRISPRTLWFGRVPTRATGPFTLSSLRLSNESTLFRPVLVQPRKDRCFGVPEGR